MARMNKKVSEMHNLWPSLVTVGEIVYPPGGRFGPRIQQFLQLLILYTGHVNVWIDGVVHHIPAQNVLLLLPGHEEYFVFAEDTETRHSWVHLRLSLDADLHHRLMALEQRPLALSPVMNQLSHDILLQDAIALSTTQEIIKALALQMFWRYIGESEFNARYHYRGGYTVVEQARLFIQAHLHEPLTLERIARELAISPAHFIRLFRFYSGTTPMNYVWECRVNKGLTLLKETGLTIEEIAAQCGFQTRYHFSRRVRQLLGYGPQEVRRRLWERPGNSLRKGGD